MPKLWEQLYFQHPAQILDPGCAARATLESDDAFNRCDVVKSPAAEIIFEINEFLGQFIGLPMGFGITVDGFPDGAYACICNP